jgi:hypothetical protein
MSGKSSSRQAPGGGVGFSDLPRSLQVNILQRIPILELRRLHKDKVSPRFSAAIKRTLGEIALKCQEAILEADRSGDKDTDAYRQRYLLSNVADWQVATAYSAPDCYWREGPLSAEETRTQKWTAWNGDAESWHLDRGGLKVPVSQYSSSPLGPPVGRRI